jgi:hypothetical protein
LQEYSGESRVYQLLISPLPLELIYNLKVI